MTRSMINMTHLGTGLANDRNFFMLLAICLQCCCFEPRIFQELNGTTMSENTGWPRRNGYYAGNMDVRLIHTQKSGL